MNSEAKVQIKNIWKPSAEENNFIKVRRSKSSIRVHLLHKGIFLNLHRSHSVIEILNYEGYYGLEMWLCEAQNDCWENFVLKPHENKVTLHTEKKMED